MNFLALVRARLRRRRGSSHEQAAPELSDEQKAAVVSEHDTFSPEVRPRPRVNAHRDPDSIGYVLLLFDEMVKRRDGSD